MKHKIAKTMIESEVILQEIQGVTIVNPGAQKYLLQVCEWVKDLPGAVAECGVYRGGTLRLLARALPDKTVWGFDSFQGMPPVRDFDSHKEGDFGNTSYAEVSNFISDLNNVRLIPGIFPGTFKYAENEKEFCLVHLDCDIYDSYMSALSFFMPRLVEGGYLITDDCHICQGAKRAIDEVFPDIEKPPYVIRKIKGYETVRKRDF